MTEVLDHSPTVVRHPSASLYHRVFALALPSVVTIASHKNVILIDGEHEAVLHDALKETPRKSLKRIVAGNEEASFALGLAISHAIDVLAMKRLITIAYSICERPLPDDVALTLQAEASLRSRTANDKGLTIAIWRNPVEEMADYVRSVFADPVISLPATATVRAMARGTTAGEQGSGGRP